MTFPAADELLRSCTRSAVHLETRDGYSQADPMYVSWQGGFVMTTATVLRGGVRG